MLVICCSALISCNEVLEKRTHRGKAQVLVKWTGYADKSNSWEPAEAILHSQQ